MKHHTIYANLILSVLFCLPQAIPAETVLVNPLEVHQSLDDDNLVILHVGPKAEFAGDHIPGAQYISLMDVLVNYPDGLSHEIPPVAQVDSVLQSKGVNGDSRVIIYYTDDRGVYIAARILMTLEVSGIEARLLDGGLASWKRDGFPTTDQVSEPERGSFKSLRKYNILVDSQWIMDHLDDPDVRIIDARPENEYAGRNKNSHFARKGHIAGAVSLPFHTVTSEDDPLLFKEPDRLRQEFADAGILADDTVVVYCGTGVWASQVYAAAKQLGYSTRFYDGSFQEWSGNEELPIVAPSRRWKLW